VSGATAVRPEYLPEALSFLGHRDDYRFEGVGSGRWPSEGYYVARDDEGWWVGGYTERGGREPIVRLSDARQAATWLFARVTGSTSADEKRSVVVWRRPAFAAARDRMARALAPVRRQLLAAPGVAVRAQLRPGHMLDEIGDRGVLVPTGELPRLESARHLLVAEPVLVEITEHQLDDAADGADVAGGALGADVARALVVRPVDGSSTEAMLGAELLSEILVEGA
jgi:hypothetical protein